MLGTHCTHRPSPLVLQVCRHPSGWGHLPWEGARRQSPAAGACGRAEGLQHLGERQLPAGLSRMHRRHGECPRTLRATGPAESAWLQVAGYTYSMCWGRTVRPVGFGTRWNSHLPSWPWVYPFALSSVHVHLPWRRQMDADHACKMLGPWRPSVPVMKLGDGEMLTG